MLGRFFHWLFRGTSGQPSASEHPPADASGDSRFYRQVPHAKQLIVFVHGVFGGRATTWGTGPTSWPEFVVGDGRFDGYDLYLLDYPTFYIVTTANIHEVAGNQLQRLRDQRIFETYEEIHFIAHSMGGLVTKSMLTRLARGTEGDLLRRVRSVVFLATPAQGSYLAQVGSWLSQNPQLANMTPAHANAFLQALEDEWVVLLIERDRTRARFPRVYCAYETHELHGVLVVPRELAYSRSDSELQPMALDHCAMTISTRRDADPYAWTMARLQEAGDFDRSVDRIDTLLAAVEELTASGKRDEAGKACNEAVTLSRQLGDPVVLARALRELAAFELAVGRSDESRARFAEALVLCRTDPERRGEARILTGLADLERLKGRHPEARELYFQARAAFRAHEDRVGEADVLRGLGEVERLCEEHESAQRYFDDALLLYRQAGKPPGEAGVFLGMGNIECLRGHFDAARDLFTKATATFQGVNDRRGLGYGLSGLARIDLLQGHNGAARKNLELARDALQQSGIGRRGHAHVLVTLGSLEFKLGYPERARAAWEEAKVLYRAIGDQLGEANVLRWLGVLEHHLGHLDEAMTGYVEARALYRKESSPLGEANTLVVLADLSRALGRYELARRQYTEADVLYRDIGNPQGRAQALRGLGILECSLRRPEAAETWLNVALGLVQDQKYPTDEADVRCGIGALESLRGRGTQAGEAYARARDIYRDEEYRRGEGDALCGLGEHAARLGNYDEAFTLYQTALELSRDTRYLFGEAVALFGKAHAEYLLNHLPEARAHAVDASKLYRSLEDRLGEARSLDLRGRIEASAAPELGARYQAQAQLLYEMLGVPPIGTSR